MNNSIAMETPQPSKALNIALWIAQVAFGSLFLVAGFTKLTLPIPELAVSMNYADDIPESMMRFIGLSELLGGIGLLLPSLLRIKPVLTPLAAAGLATVMLLAIVFHIMRGEFPVVIFNLVLGSVAAFIAWGRFKKAPIAPRM